MLPFFFFLLSSALLMKSLTRMSIHYVFKINTYSLIICFISCKYMTFDGCLTALRNYSYCHETDDETVSVFPYNHPRIMTMEKITLAVNLKYLPHLQELSIYSSHIHTFLSHSVNPLINAIQTTEHNSHMVNVPIDPFEAQEV